MNAHRVNITLPRSLVERLRSKPNRSAFIAEAVREKLARDERAKEEVALARAYREAARASGKAAADWDDLLGEDL